MYLVEMNVAFSYGLLHGHLWYKGGELLTCLRATWVALLQGGVHVCNSRPLTLSHKKDNSIIKILDVVTYSFANRLSAIASPVQWSVSGLQQLAPAWSENAVPAQKIPVC